jgi:hypothetical protein
MNSPLRDVTAAAGRVLRTRDGMSDVLVPAPAVPFVTDRACGNGVVLSHGDERETQLIWTNHRPLARIRGAAAFQSSLCS